MAEIKMDVSQVAQHNTALKTAGATLADTKPAVETSGLSGMPAGKRFAELTYDLYAALLLYKQLVDKNSKHIDNMKNEYEQLDKSLSK